MNKQTEALKELNELLTEYHNGDLIQPFCKWTEDVLYKCKEALEDISKMETTSQPAQEPVAWLYKRENSSGGWYVVTNYEKEHDNGARNIECYDIPLYTHPAPAWQGLSDDEIEYWECLKAPPVHPDFLEDDSWREFARCIEQALKKKNEK